MEWDKKTTGPDGARLAEVTYHKRQNRLVILLLSLPTMIFYTGFYVYLSNYFQATLFVLMTVNTATGLIIGSRLIVFE